MKQVDITIIINCHNEYEVLLPTLSSARNSRLFAEKAGLKIETLIIADASDERMKTLLNNYAKDEGLLIDNIYPINFKDLGLARNAGVEKARGKFISFLDGDDLYSENWLLLAYNLLQLHPHAIAHPEACLYFGRDPHWWRHISSTDEDFSAGELLAHNYWTALSFGKKEIYTSIPYSECIRAEGLGYEDWHWNCQTLSKGITHLVAPHTAHYIRLKDQSMTLDYHSLRAIIPRTNFFLSSFSAPRRSSFSLKLKVFGAHFFMFLARFHKGSFALDRIVLRLLSVFTPRYLPPAWLQQDLSKVSSLEHILNEQQGCYFFRGYQYKDTLLAKTFYAYRDLLIRSQKNAAFYLVDDLSSAMSLPDHALIFVLNETEIDENSSSNKIALGNLKTEVQKALFFTRFVLDLNPSQIVVSTSAQSKNILAMYRALNGSQDKFQNLD